MYILKKFNKDPKKASRFFNWAFEKNGLNPSSAIYSLVLRIFANKESMNQFWAYHYKKWKKGFNWWDDIHNSSWSSSELEDGFRYLCLDSVIQKDGQGKWDEWCDEEGRHQVGLGPERELGEMKISGSKN